MFLHGSAEDSASMRSRLGAWLRAAVSRDATQPALGGLVDGGDGWTYATDGHRVHAIKGYADQSGRVRCPHTGVNLDVGDAPDVAAAMAAWPDAAVVCVADARALTAACEGLAKTAKVVNGGTRCALDLEPAEDRLTVAIYAGADDSVRGAVELRECSFNRSPDSGRTVIHLNLGYLVAALKGFRAVDGNGTVILEAHPPEPGDTWTKAPLVIRRPVRAPESDAEGVLMVAVITPMTARDDGGGHHQDKLPGLVRESIEPSGAQWELGLDAGASSPTRTVRRRRPAPPPELDRQCLAAGEKPEPDDDPPAPVDTKKDKANERARRYRAKARGKRAASANQPRQVPAGERRAADWLAGYDAAKGAPSD